MSFTIFTVFVSDQSIYLFIIILLFNWVKGVDGSTTQHRLDCTKGDKGVYSDTSVPHASFYRLSNLR